MALVLVVGACTSENQRICAVDQRCRDTTAPLCDLDGVLGPTRNTCVNVSCLSGEPLICADGVAYTCNALADGYDRHACDLGCAQGQPTCRALPASNGLGELLASAAAAPAIELIDLDVLDIATGEVRTRGGFRMQLAGVLIPVTGGGAPIIAYAASSLIVRGAVELRDPSSSGSGVAFVVAGEVLINGTLALTGTAAAPPAGSVSCGVGAGRVVGTSAIGSAGAGHATSGGASGGFTGMVEPGVAGGAPFAQPTLEPLRGGCHGGFAAGTSAFASRGGGALQISSSASITVSSAGSIEAGALAGARSPPGQPAVGGGAGGAILLEAPRIQLRRGAILSANGAGGASGTGDPPSSPARGAPSVGQDCRQTTFCTRGGDGGHLGGGAQSSSSITANGTNNAFTGGGGGAAGLIRFNTTATLVREDGVIVSPAPTLGKLEEL